MMNKAMRFGLTLFQHPLLVLLGESNVELQSPMSMHEFDTMNLEFCAAQPMGALCDIGKLHDPFLKRLTQRS